MKAHSGLMELVIIIAMMVGSVPLLTTLVITCSRTKMSYLDDKTIYKMSDSIEWVEQNVNGSKTLVPTSLAPISIDYGGAQAIAIVNDEYCPSDGRLIYYDYTADSIFTGHNTNTPSLSITYGWKSLMMSNWGQQLGYVKNGTTISSLDDAYKNSKCYLIWSATDKHWVITTKFVNIFEVKK